MADYKGIKGFKVQSLAADPTLVEGQVWYNTTGSALKYLGVGAGAWAAATSLNTARAYLSASNIGTQTAALVVGGTSSAPTEVYNGSTWTETTDPNTPRSKAGGIGTSTLLTLAAGDNVSPPPAAKTITEIWNGSTWTEVADINSARYNFGEAGTSPASLIFGGQPGAPPYTSNAVELWNGTSWAEQNNLNTSCFENAGAGTVSTAALSFGGRTTDENESWDGTSWTEVNNLNTAREDLGGSGTQTAALAYGGTPGAMAVTELWDGTSWTEVADLGTARFTFQGIGPSTAAICAGGTVPPASLLVEEWSGAPLSVKTVTTS
jgi:hypothetical protein